MPPANLAAELLTVEDYRGTPEGKRYQLIEGELHAMSNSQFDKKPKRRIYARAGVKEMWLVDPLLLQVQRYDFEVDQAKPVQLIEETETFSAPLLPGLELATAEIFKR